MSDGGNSKSLGLLQLSGDVAGNRLIICKPEAKRPQFDLRKAANPTTPSNPSAS
jgi:antitoxin component of MazEF toxin-antitoxin module